MKIEYPDPKIICDVCRSSETATEQTAEAEGWSVDRESIPHAHVCPACKGAAL